MKPKGKRRGRRDADNDARSDADSDPNTTASYQTSDKIDPDPLATALKDKDQKSFFNILDQCHRIAILARIKAKVGYWLDFPTQLDIYQTVMVKLMYCLPWKDDQPDFDCDRPLRIVMWLADRIAIDFWRRKNTHAEGPQATNDLVLNQFAVPEPDFDATAFRQDLAEALRMISFTEIQRQAIKVLVENLAEIRKKDRNQRVAELLGTTQESARSALRAVFKKLKKFLTERGWAFLTEMTGGFDEWGKEARPKRARPASLGAPGGAGSET